MSLTSLSIPFRAARLCAAHLTGVALLAAAAHSSASATTHVSASGFTGIVNAGGTLQTPITLTEGTLPHGGVSVSGEGSTVGLLGNGNVTATAGVTGMAQASYGLLRARVGGGLFALSDQPADDPFVRGEFGASFDDTLVVSSSTLTIGSPVTLQMTMSVDVVIAPNNGALFDIHYQLGNAAGQVVDLDRNTGGYGSFTYVPSQVYGFTYPVTFADTVGDTLYLSSMLKVGIYQYFDPYRALYGPFAGQLINNQPSVDASHTSKVFLDALTPGVTLVAASGHDYGTLQAVPVSPVPEPAEASLMLLGLAALVRVRRSSRNKTMGAARR